MRSGAARIAAALASVVLLVVPANALAADAFVDNNAATNTPPCTAAQPCQSIQTGIFDAGVGDTIRVDGGTYNANVNLSDGKSLIEEEFNGGDGDSQATIDGGASVAITVPSGGSEVEIEGFTIQSDAVGVELNSAATVTANLFDDPAAAVHMNMLSGSGLSTVQGNTFTDLANDTDDVIGVQAITSGSPTIIGNSFQNLRTGMHLANGSPAVSGNTITGTRQSPSDLGTAIVVVSGSPTIVGNDIHSPALPLNAFGIQLVEFAGPPATGATLRRNEIYDHRGGVRTNDTEGTVTLNGDVIAGNTESGILAVDNAPLSVDEGDVKATNVTAFDNPNNDVVLIETDIGLDSSIVGDPVGDFNNGTCAIAFSRGPTMTPGGTGCDGFQTTAAPQFVNPGANNYHLLAGSPMIDAGNPANPGFVQDLDGGPRAVDGDCNGSARRDIGADERATNCPAPPPTGDDDPPETEITKAPKCKTRKRKAKIEFSADEAGSSFECSLDGKAFVSCSSPFRKKVKRRRHGFAVRAIDAAGNADPTPAEHSWKVKKRKRR